MKMSMTMCERSYANTEHFDQQVDLSKTPRSWQTRDIIFVHQDRIRPPFSLRRAPCFLTLQCMLQQTYLCSIQPTTTSLWSLPVTSVDPGNMRHHVLMRSTCHTTYQRRSHGHHINKNHRDASSNLCQRQDDHNVEIIHNSTVLKRPRML